MSEKSLVEKAAGLPAQAVTTLIASSAAASGILFAELLPLLTATLAHSRHTQRVEGTLNQFKNDLSQYREDFSDSQYKLINEIILVSLQTVEEEKLTYLKQIFRNTLKEPNIDASTQISRIIRDISASELTFIKDYFGYQVIAIGVASKTEKELVITEGSTDHIAFSGLVSLGLITFSNSTFDTAGLYKFSPLVAKLITLLK